MAWVSPRGRPSRNAAVSRSRVSVVRLGHNGGRDRACVFAGVVRGRGELHSALAEHAADRDDPEPIPVSVDMVDDQYRSSACHDYAPDRVAGANL